MTDLEFLFAVLAAFYLWECTHWLPLSTLAFASWWPGAPPQYASWRF
jgi:hypothetical protein